MGSSSTSWVSESNTHAGTSKVFTSSAWDAIVSADSLKINAAEAGSAKVELWADEGDDNADKWLWQVADGGTMTWQSYTGGSYATKLTLNTSGDVIAAGEISVAATNKIYFDGDSGHSYISESAADTLSIYAGGTEMLKIDQDNLVSVLRGKLQIVGTSIVTRVNIDETTPIFGIQIHAANTSWARSYNFGNYSNNNQLGGFFGSGTDNALTRLTIGTAYDTAAGIHWDVTNSKCGIGTVSPASYLHVAGTVQVGVDDTGYDVKFFGNTSGKYMEWDTSADQLDVTGSFDVTGNSTMVGTLTVGVDDTGHDVKFFGATTGSFMLWDESDDALELTDSTPLKIGDSADMEIYHDGSNSYIKHSGTGELRLGTTTSSKAISIGHTTSVTTINDELDVTGTVDINDTTDASSSTTGALKVDGGVGVAKKLYVGTDLAVDGTSNLDAVDIDGNVQIDGTVTAGVDDTGYDVKFFGATSGSYMLWDQSDDALKLVNAYLEGPKLSYQNVTADDTLTEAESGKLFIFNDADGAVLTLPDSGGGDLIGVTYHFYIAVTITSNSHKVVCTDTTNEKLYGQLHAIDTDGDASSNIWAAQAGDSFSAITTDGTTKAQIGSRFSVTNIAADVWHVNGNIHCAGTPATPFAAS